MKQAKYNVATLDYISNGGDGFFDFKEAPSLLLNGNEVGDIMMHDLEKAMPNPVSPEGPLVGSFLLAVKVCSCCHDDFSRPGLLQRTI